jgi:hypothetical protein
MFSFVNPAPSTAKIISFLPLMAFQGSLDQFSFLLLRRQMQADAVCHSTTTNPFGPKAFWEINVSSIWQLSG